MKRLSTETARMLMSTIWMLTSCFYRDDDGDDVQASSSASSQCEADGDVQITSSAYSQSEEVTMYEYSILLEQLRPIAKQENLGTFHYETSPASLRSVSTESLEELDISCLPLSLDEINIIRKHQQAEKLAASLKAERERKRRLRRLFRKMRCFGRE